jgi:hypothetical protein
MPDLMANQVLIYIGSAIIILWGIAHLIPTKPIVKGFGDISADNKKILTQGLISEGLTLIFLGALPLTLVLNNFPISVNALIVYRGAAAMLVVMAGVTFFTGAKTPIIWYKICPAVKLTTAILFYLASVINL